MPRGARLGGRDDHTAADVRALRRVVRAVPRMATLLYTAVPLARMGTGAPEVAAAGGVNYHGQGRSRFMVGVTWVVVMPAAQRPYRQRYHPDPSRSGTEDPCEGTQASFWGWW